MNLQGSETLNILGSFTSRMKYCQLKEYISSLKQLKERYAGTINIFSGLEIEYLPFFKTYYEELKANENI